MALLSLQWDIDKFMRIAATGEEECTGFIQVSHAFLVFSGFVHRSALTFNLGRS